MAMLFMLLISLDTELTQKIPLPCRKNKKTPGLVCTTSLSHSLFFLFWGERQLHRHKCTTCRSFLSYSFPPPHLCSTLGGYDCCIQCMNPVLGRQTFTNQLCKLLHPYLPPETNICLCLAQVLLFQLFGYIVLEAFLTS